MTALHTLRALDSNRRFTERKEAEGRMAQARRDLDAGVIDAENTRISASCAAKLSVPAGNAGHAMPAICTTAAQAATGMPL